LLQILKKKKRNREGAKRGESTLGIKMGGQEEEGGGGGGEGGGGGWREEKKKEVEGKISELEGSRTTITDTQK